MVLRLKGVNKDFIDIYENDDAIEFSDKFVDRLAEILLSD